MNTNTNVPGKPGMAAEDREFFFEFGVSAVLAVAIVLLA